MDDSTLRALIRDKLRSGRLPLNKISRFWGGPADGEICDACDQRITKQQLVMEGIASVLDAAAKDKKPIQFHVRCFQVWDAERRAPAA